MVGKRGREGKFANRARAAGVGSKHGGRESLKFLKITDRKGLGHRGGGGGERLRKLRKLPNRDCLIGSVI